MVKSKEGVRIPHQETAGKVTTAQTRHAGRWSCGRQRNGRVNDRELMVMGCRHSIGRKTCLSKGLGS
jgi:hypothetical protein